MTTSCKDVSETPAATAVQEVKTERPVYEPAADVIEKPDSILVLLDLSGVDQKGLDITVEDHVLTVRGKSAVTESKAESSLYREFEPADYERSFRLTQDIDESRIIATIKNGLVRVVLPKSEKANPRQIAIQAD